MPQTCHILQGAPTHHNLLVPDPKIKAVACSRVVLPGMVSLQPRHSQSHLPKVQQEVSQEQGGNSQTRLEDTFCDCKMQATRHFQNNYFSTRTWLLEKTQILHVPSHSNFWTIHPFNEGCSWEVLGDKMLLITSQDKPIY